MSDTLSIEGRWPSPLILTRGWSRATARPWNDKVSAAMVRLERGRSDFLSDVSAAVAPMAGGTVYSPALYPQSTRIWRRSGYREAHRLDVMERPVPAASTKPSVTITETQDPDWKRIKEIDDMAFEGFWGMSILGIEEALGSTKQSAVLTVGSDPITGYAVVGAQWHVAYLQRLAVDPNYSGRRLGSELTRAAIAWGYRVSARVMVLNVRPDNVRAKRLYDKEGFSVAGTSLRILRYEPHLP